MEAGEPVVSAGRLLAWNAESRAKSRAEAVRLNNLVMLKEWQQIKDLVLRYSAMKKE